MANDLEQNSDAVLSTAIAKDGPVTVSGTQIHDVVVQVLHSLSHLEHTPCVNAQWPEAHTLSRCLQ